MTFFSDGSTRDKLCILYLLRTMEIELTRLQLTSILSENAWIPYFEAQTYIHELEEDGLIAAIPRSFGQGYRLTQSGENTLELFLQRIPLSVREAYDAYAQANRDRLCDEKRFETSVQRLPSGAYGVSLKVLEKDKAILEVRIDAPEAKWAQHAAKTWSQKAESIYQFLFKTLMLDD